jgi:hypothetical protein
MCSPSETVEKNGKYGLGELVAGSGLKSNICWKQIQSVFTYTYLFLDVNFVTGVNNMCYFLKMRREKCLSFCWKLSPRKRVYIGSSLVPVIYFVLSERHDSIEILALCYCSLGICFQDSNMLSREWLHYLILAVRRKEKETKGKFHTITCHVGREGVSKYSSTISLNSAVDGVGWLTSRPGRFTLGNDPVLIV